MEGNGWPARACTWIGYPVRLGAVQVGTVSDVIANVSLGHVLGFEIRTADHSARFLPWVGADIEDGCIRPRSLYSLLSQAELPLYVDHGVRLSERVSLGNGNATAQRAALRDVLVDRHGDISALVVADGHAVRMPEVAPVPSGDTRTAA